MMDITSIRKALVATYVAANLGLDTCYENEDFETTPDTFWIKFSFVPNMPEVHCLGRDGLDLITGFAQFDINGPLGIGEKQHMSYAEALKNVFPTGESFTYNEQVVKIKTTGRSQGRVVEGFYRVSVTIAWYAYLQRLT